MIDVKEIMDFVQADTLSRQKERARMGDRYYNGIHDITNYRIYYVNGEGKLVEDLSRSNIKISHPFFTELVDQSVQYLLSGDNYILRSDIPELQVELNRYFNEDEDFMAELYDVITGTMVKGFEYMYAYMGRDGRLHFQCADSLGVVEVYGKDTSDKQDYILYWWIEYVGGQEVLHVEVWDKDSIYYYKMGDDGLELDRDVPINPRPHVIYYKDGEEEPYYDGFGYLPFFRLDNGRKRQTALLPVKDLIDDYDLMSCGLSNNLQDITEGIYVVTGFQGDNLDELIDNLKVKKHIGVDAGGSVDIKTIDIPYEARRAKLELDENNIYRFGMGFNSVQIGDGNVTNVVIRSRYALLDMKCNKLEIRLKQFLRKLLSVVLDEINTRDGTGYQSKDVWFNFKREIMTNATDNATIEKTDAERKQVEINTILSLSTYIDDETVLENICDILELDYTTIRDRMPEQPVGMMELLRDEEA